MDILGTDRSSRVDVVLNWIERAGNRLPDPFLLFAGLFLFVGVLSTVLSLAGAAAIIPGQADPVPVRGAFSAEGLRFILTEMPSNFAGFPPLGTVLTILLAVGVAQGTGLLAAAARWAFGRAPSWALPYLIGVVGVSANIMSDSAFIVLPPLAAVVFKAAGRHPVAGLILGFGSAMGGFTASVFVTTTDALYAGVTTVAAAALPVATTPVTAVSNYYFSAIAAVVGGVLVGWVTHRMIEPRLWRQGIPVDELRVREEQGDESAIRSTGGRAGSPSDAAAPPDARLSHTEAGALRAALLTGAFLVVALTVVALLPDSLLRSEDGGFLPKSPLLDSVVALVFILFLVPALVYGCKAGTIAAGRDVPAMMIGALRDVTGYIVLIFAISQFLAIFAWSNISTYLAVQGAELLESIGLTGFGAILSFIVLVSILNFVIGSSTSLWTLMAAVFVPLFVLLGYEPSFTQAAFRIGDSATQLITPLNPHLLVLLAFMRKYEPSIRLGTVIARLAPYVPVIWIAWVLLFAGFYLGDLPFGPGGDIFTN